MSFFRKQWHITFFSGTQLLFFRHTVVIFHARSCDLHRMYANSAKQTITCIHPLQPPGNHIPRIRVEALELLSIKLRLLLPVELMSIMSNRSSCTHRLGSRRGVTSSWSDDSKSSSWTRFLLGFISECRTCFITQVTSPTAESQSSVPSTPRSPRHQLKIRSTDRNPFWPGRWRESQGPAPPILRQLSTRKRQGRLTKYHHFQSKATKVSTLLIVGCRFGARGHQLRFQIPICSGQWVAGKPVDCRKLWGITWERLKSDSPGHEIEKPTPAQSKQRGTPSNHHQTWGHHSSHIFH
jgi:hypothetical protein